MIEACSGSGELRAAVITSLPTVTSGDDVGVLLVPSLAALRLHEAGSDPSHLESLQSDAADAESAAASETAASWAPPGLHTGDVVMIPARLVARAQGRLRAAGDQEGWLAAPDAQGLIETERVRAGTVLLPPTDPCREAERIRRTLALRLGDVQIGVLVSQRLPERVQEKVSTGSTGEITRSGGVLAARGFTVPKRPGHPYREPHPASGTGGSPDDIDLPVIERVISAALRALGMRWPDEVVVLRGLTQWVAAGE